MSDPQLLEGESFFVDPMELIEAKKEIRRLNSLIDSKEAIHEKTVENLNQEIASLKCVNAHVAIEAAGSGKESVLLLNVICFLLLWKEIVFSKKHKLVEGSELEGRKLVNMIKAVDTFFEPYFASSGVDIREHFMAFVDYLNEHAFFYKEGDKQKIGALPDFEESPISKLLADATILFKEEWKARRENKKVKKKRGAAAKKIA